MTNVWRSEGKFQNLILTFHHMPSVLQERNIESEIEHEELI